MNIYINDTVDYPFQMRSMTVYIDRLGIPPIHSEWDDDDEQYTV